MKRLYTAAFTACAVWAFAQPSLSAQITYHMDHRTTPKIIFQPDDKVMAPGDYKEAADQYWQKHAQMLGINNELTTLKLAKIKQSLLAKHLYFQQYINGIPVQYAELVISIDPKTDSVTRVFNNTYPVTKKISSKPTLSGSQALDIAWQHIKVHGKLSSLPKVESEYLVQGDAFRLIYRTHIAVSAPQGYWEHIIDADSGKILSVKSTELSRIPKQSTESIEDLTTYFDAYQGPLTPRDEATQAYRAHMNEISNLMSGPDSQRADGKATLFDPDPRTLLGDMSLEDDVDPMLIEAAYIQDTLKDLTKKNGTYHLIGPWVTIQDFDPPSTEPSTTADGIWDARRGDNRFNDAMTYYHIDQSQRYMQSLGFIGEKGIQFGAITVDTDGVGGSDNSYFDSNANAMSFGHGCVDDNEDADVILHEYGHAINYSINNSWSGGDTGAMGEGFGDYWAASHSLSSLNGPDFHPEKVFTWDGHNDCWDGRVLNRLDAKYNPNNSYSAHVNVDGVITDELWSTPIFQALLELVKLGYPREDADKIILEAQFGLGANLSMRDMALSVVETAGRLFPNMPHSEIYGAHFRRHNMLPERLILVDARVEDSGKNQIADPGELVSVSFELKNQSSQPLKNVVAHVTSNTKGVELIQNQSFYEEIAAGTSRSPLRPFTLIIDDDYPCGGTINFSVKLMHPDDEKVLGSFDWQMPTGQADIHAQSIEPKLAIPDGQASGIVSTLTFGDTNAIITDKFSVDVKITHKAPGDLRMTLIAPDGKKVELWRNRWGRGHDIEGNFPATLKPDQDFNSLIGKPIQGTWTLAVKDTYSRDAGTLDAWGIKSIAGYQCQ